MDVNDLKGLYAECGKRMGATIIVGSGTDRLAS